MANWKTKKNRANNLDKLRTFLKEHKELTFKQLKEGLQVSDPTMTDYIKILEEKNEIEHFDKPEDRRSQWYRIKPESKDQVYSQIGKYEAIKFIESINDPIYAFKQIGKGAVAAFVSSNVENPEDVTSVVDAMAMLVPKVKKGKMAIVIMAGVDKT